jgi:RimJ/RimL family protein N-acetyltransferase
MISDVVPTLETERLLLRGFVPGDLDALAAIFSDPHVTRYINHGVRSREQVAANLAEYAAEWTARGRGVWAVVERSSGTLLGLCGFVQPAEVGYILGRGAWGKGYATEAARACLRYGFEYLGFDPIVAGALRENLGSRHVLEKLGMREHPNEYFDRNGGVYYRIARAEFAPDASLFVVRDGGDPK